MQNSNSKTYYDCLRNQESSSLTFKAPSKEQKKSRDEPLIKIIISLAKAKDFIKIPNLQHAALEGIEIYNENTYVEFHLLLCKLLYQFNHSLGRLHDLQGKSPTVVKAID